MILSYGKLNDKVIQRLKNEKQYDRMTKEKYAIVWSHPVHGYSVTTSNDIHEIEYDVKSTILNRGKAAIRGVFKDMNPMNIAINIEVTADVAE